MNEYINKDKITTQNWKEAETEKRFPEFYQKIRESDAWMKHLHHIIIDLDVERNIPKNDKAKAWNEWVDAKKELVGDLDEKNASLCDYFVGAIIRDDLKHWRLAEKV